MIDAPEELKAFLREEYARCEDTTLEDERVTAIDRYNGEPYGDEEDGSSQVVARDTFETINYMVISILRTLVSGQNVVEFASKNVDAAHEATETLMHLFMDEQDGYMVLHDWLKAGLLEKNAVAMTYSEQMPAKRKVHEGVSALALTAAQQNGLKIIEAEQTGEGEEGPVFTVTEMAEQPPKFCDAAVPNEEFYCSPDARTITEAALKGRKVRKSTSDLVAAKIIDKDEASTLKPISGMSNALSDARSQDRQTGLEYTSRQVWWHEEYVRFDLNGDGIDELLYIQRDEEFNVYAIDEMEDAEDHPFEDWSPIPTQHRRVGLSLADMVMDLERINTVLLRQSLNGIYIANNPSTYLHEDSIGDNTIEDILTVRAGRVVRWKGQVAPVERQGNFDPGAGFQMLEFMTRARESRTGITRLNMGLDEDTLNDTASGQAQLIARGEQVEEYIARNFANGVAKLFTKKAKMLQRYGQPILVPIDGEYKQVDPRQWPEDMIARARVGLGVANKSQRLAARQQVIGMQAQALQAGLGIVDDQSFYNSAKGFVSDTGLGDVSQFFNEPPKGPDGKPLPKQPKPDPAMAKVQAEIQQKQQELQLKQTESGAKLQLQQAEAQAKLGMMQQQGMQKAQLDQQRAIFDNQLAQSRAQFEAQLAERQTQLDTMLEMQKIAAQERTQGQANELNASVRKNRPGGDLSK